MRANHLNLKENMRSTDRLYPNGFLFNREKLNVPLISIIIPIYNEEKTIRDVIERIPNHQQYEILLVDDGSTDNSLEKVQEISNREIKIIKHQNNKGYGVAVLSGFKHAAGDIIITMDSDGQHNPEEITALIKPIINNQADIVVGSRYLGNCHYKNPLYARVGAYFINIFLNMLFLQKVYDNQCGFRAFSNRSFKIFKNLRQTKYGFCTETLFEAIYNKLRVCEIPINVNIRKYGKSNIDLVKLLISVSFCILYYSIKRFKVYRFIPNQILAKIKNRVIFLFKKFM